MMRKILILVIGLLSFQTYADGNMGRLGVGMTNELANGVPAISFKVRKNKDFALGAIAGYRSNPDNRDYGFGGKVFSTIYDEANLNFYSALMLAFSTYRDENDDSESAIQFNGVLGSEFHFTGLESLGFSFEFGLSLYKDASGSNISTLGNSFLNAAIHFYI